MKRFFLFILVAVFSASIVFGRQPQRGYRGFIEWSSSVRSEKFLEWSTPGANGCYRDRLFYTGFSTSHGYQINPMFFVGAGLGMEYGEKLDNWIAPVFAQCRMDFEFGKFTPFGDLRLGYNMSDGGGVYFSPTVGHRFNWGRKMGINVGAGLTLAGYTVEQYNGWIDESGYIEMQYVGTKHKVRPYFSFRVGIDF